MPADIDTSTWSETAASNNATPPGGWPEGQAPSTVNDCAREIMGAVKREWNRSHPTVTSGGSANVQTLTYTTAPAAYVQGHTFSFIAGFTNTGTATLNVNSVGAKNIFADNKALAGGEITAGMVVTVVYDGTQFQIVSRQPLISAPYGWKNIIINGDFNIQQRGAGGAINAAVGASTVAYTIDRWVLTTNANQASTVAVTTGANCGATQSRFAAVIQRTAAQTGTGTMTFQAPLTTDQLSMIVGKIVTLSFKINFGATFITNNSAGVTAALYMGTGTEGKRGAGFSTETSTCSVTTTVAATTTPLSATSAAVVPTTTTQGCILFSWTPTATAGATDQVILAEVQLEVGGAPTSFDRRPFDVELARCQRFFQKSFAYGTAPATGVATNGLVYLLPTGASGQLGGTWLLPVTMRIAGSITTYNPVSANANWRDTTNGADRTVSSATAFTSNILLTATGGVAGSVNTIQYAIDADL